MRPFTLHRLQHRAAPAPLPPLGAWLLGAIEFLALARSRWSRRARPERGF